MSDPLSEPITAGGGDPAGEFAEATDQSSPPNGVPTDDSAAHADVERDLDELTAKAAKAEEYLGLAQRTKADFENFRKRAARDAALAQERGFAKLAKELLPAIDNLDRALQAALAVGAAQEAGESESSEAAEPGTVEQQAGSAESVLVTGVKLVHADLVAALARVGIEPFAPVGEPFDPQYHEAVAQAPQEGFQPGTVVEVYQQGYRLGETVLRPARVLVAA